MGFMDEREGAGWKLLSELLAGKQTALQLSMHPFLRP